MPPLIVPALTSGQRQLTRVVKAAQPPEPTDPTVPLKELPAGSIRSGKPTTQTVMTREQYERIRQMWLRGGVDIGTWVGPKTSEQKRRVELRKMWDNQKESRHPLFERLLPAAGQQFEDFLFVRPAIGFEFLRSLLPGMESEMLQTVKDIQKASRHALEEQGLSGEGMSNIEAFRIAREEHQPLYLRLLQEIGTSLLIPPVGRVQAMLRLVRSRLVGRAIQGLLGTATRQVPRRALAGAVKGLEPLVRAEAAVGQVIAAPIVGAVRAGQAVTRAGTGAVRGIPGAAEAVTGRLIPPVRRLAQVERGTVGREGAEEVSRIRARDLPAADQALPTRSLAENRLAAVQARAISLQEEIQFHEQNLANIRRQLDSGMPDEFLDMPGGRKPFAQFQIPEGQRTGALERLSGFELEADNLLSGLRREEAKVTETFRAAKAAVRERSTALTPQPTSRIGQQIERGVANRKAIRGHFERGVPQKQTPEQMQRFREGIVTEEPGTAVPFTGEGGVPDLPRGGFPSKTTGPPPPGAAAGASAESVGNSFAAPLRPIEDVMNEVVTSDNPVVRTALRGINPSVRGNSTVGRTITAYHRQSVASGELTKVTVTAALDPHAQRFSARMGEILPINKDGLFGDTGVPWNDVFSNAGVHKLSSGTKAYIDDFLKVIDEVEGLRVAAGLRPRAIKGKDGWLYVPRQVKTVRGVELQRPSNPNLQRLHEEAADGYAKGVRYDADPRATLEVHVRAAYKEIAEKQLSDVLETLSITPKQLVRAPVRIRMEKAVQVRKQAERALRDAKFAEKRWLKRHEKELPGVLTLGKQRNLNKLQAGIKEAKAQLEKGMVEYDSAKRAYSRAMEAARRAEIAPGQLFGRTENTIAIDSWRNRFYTREEAEFIKENMGLFGAQEARRSPAARGVEIVANQIRFLAAVGDFAAPFIHGLHVITTNPAAWGRATLAHYQAFFDPTVHSRFIRDHLETMQKMAREGIPVGDPEMFAALQAGGGLSPGRLLEFFPKGTEVRALMQAGGRQTFGRFQSSYNVFLTESRALLWESMETSARFRNNFKELARTIRNLTGGLDSRALGVGPNQRAVEGAWMAFSPRLLRSTVALTADAISAVSRLALLQRPNAGQVQAIQTLATLAAGVTGIYIASGLALGKSWAQIKEGLNPLNGKRYLSHEINGDWVGVGGQVRAITQIIGKLASTLAPGGAPVGDFLKVDQFDNPLIGLYYSRGAPALQVVGAGAELALDKDILPFETIDTLPDLFKHIGTSALPFAAQGRLEGEQVSTTMIALAGLRTSPQTPAESRDFRRAEVLRERGIAFEAPPGTLAFKDEFRELGADIQRQINTDPRVQQAQEDVAEGQRERNSEYQAYKDEREEINEKYDDLIGKAAIDLGPSRAFRIALAVHQRDRARDKKALEGRSQDALAFIEELDPSTAQFDIALNAYLEALDDPALENEATQEYDFDERTRRIEELTRQYGEGMIERIEIFLHETELPVAAQLRADRKLMEPYWAVVDSMNINPEARRIFKEYLDADRRRQAQIGRQYDWISRIISAQQNARERLRKQHFELDVVLIRWGYVTTPVTREGVVEFRRLVSRSNVPTRTEPLQELPPGSIRESSRELVGAGR